MKFTYMMYEEENNTYTFTREWRIGSVQYTARRTISKEEAEKYIGRAVMKGLKVEQYNEGTKTWKFEDAR